MDQGDVVRLFDRLYTLKCGISLNLWCHMATWVLLVAVLIKLP